MVLTSISRRLARAGAVAATFTLFLATLPGCSTVYSPYVTPPPRPLEEFEGGISASVNVLPETRPEALGASVATGGEALARFAFTDRLTMQARTWGRIDVSSPQVNGVSIEGLYMLNDSTAPVRYAVMPRLVAMFEGRSIDARAAFVGGVAWVPDLWILKPYVAIGAGIGDYIGDESAASGDRWGYAFTGNLGANVDLVANFSAGLELAAIVQVNRYDRTVSALPLLPSLSAAWKF